VYSLIHELEKKTKNFALKKKKKTGFFLLPKRSYGIE